MTTIPIHGFRHTHATFLQKLFVHLQVIADQLGHISDSNKSKSTGFAMTIHYAHITNEARKSAANAFANALQKGFADYSGLVEHSHENV